MIPMMRIIIIENQIKLHLFEDHGRENDSVDTGFTGITDDVEAWSYKDKSFVYSDITYYQFQHGIKRGCAGQCKNGVMGKNELGE